jgi:hypothetical protein
MAALRELPRGFAAGESAADYGDSGGHRRWSLVDGSDAVADALFLGEVPGQQYQLDRIKRIHRIRSARCAGGCSHSAK